MEGRLPKLRAAYSPHELACPHYPGPSGVCGLRAHGDPAGSRVTGSGEGARKFLLFKRKTKLIKGARSRKSHHNSISAS